MADASGLLIVLHTNDPARRGFWSRELAAVGTVVERLDGLDREAVGQVLTVIVVIDGASDPLQDTAVFAELLQAGRLAIVQIGPAMVALPAPEAELPADAAPREVALACRLVGRILQLRMEKHLAAAAREHLHELAHRDPLTGLLNRRGWDVALSRHFAATAAGAGGCMAMIDLDHFKQINDQFGHAVGDAVLARCAQILAAELRPADVVARLGGDEFAVLIADVDRLAAAAVVDRLLHALRAGLANEASLPVTASIGYQCLKNSRGVPDVSACMRTVDGVLHEAKRQGRGRALGT